MTIFNSSADLSADWATDALGQVISINEFLQQIEDNCGDSREMAVYVFHDGETLHGLLFCGDDECELAKWDIEAPSDIVKNSSMIGAEISDSICMKIESHNILEYDKF